MVVGLLGCLKLKYQSELIGVIPFFQIIIPFFPQLFDLLRSIPFCIDGIPFFQKNLPLNFENVLELGNKFFKVHKCAFFIFYAF